MHRSKHEPPDAVGHLRCERCGYILHGNTSELCPECGAAGPGVRHMPPQWGILIASIAIPVALLVLYVAWSLLTVPV